MHPYPKNVEFSITVEPIYLEYSLYHFAHVSQVEHIVCGGGSGSKSFYYILEQVQSSQCHWFCQRFYFLFKVLELVGQNALKYPFGLGVSREGEVEHLELRLKSFRYLCPASTRRSHGSYKLYIHYLFEKFPLHPVIPPIVVKPLSNQFQGWLGALLLFRHVQVIYENHTLFAIRNHFVASSLDQLTFNNFLHFETSSISTEYKLLIDISAFIQFLQQSIEQRCFACASSTYSQHRNLLFHAGHQNHTVTGGVSGRYKHFVVLYVVLRLPHS